MERCGAHGGGYRPPRPVARQAEHARLEENMEEAQLVVPSLNAASTFSFSPDFPRSLVSGLGTWGIRLLPIWAVVVKLFLV